MKFRNKPVVIDAEQWFPGKRIEGVFLHGDEGAPLWLEDANGHRFSFCSDQVGAIRTLEGWMIVSPGDWIITGVQGEKYPCKADIFAKTYEPADCAMGFGSALAFLKSGKKVARAGWNGKGVWLALVEAANYLILRPPHNGEDTQEGECKGLLPWIGMKTADDKFVPWLASQTDMLAEDWTVVE